MMKELEILGLVDIGKDRGENYINLGDEFDGFYPKNLAIISMTYCICRSMKINLPEIQ
jgi:hypothetical protein